ncbi:26962_t:CDS:10 [Dentiscutata erythropus]|uniref:26962_t:CDS:1 n=1 Tax=Dentiscutata erythropus TaxID=1348616 RepID=A0A9N9FYQ7_9GLOM|nr:26962_t:CDS:10 [Dentiscutata erythropus]
MVFEESNSPSRPNIEIPETKAKFFSLIICWWVNDLMSLGYKRPLEKDDLYVLNENRCAKIITDKFEIEWQKEIQKLAIGKKPSLLKALFRLILNFVSEAYFANLNNSVQPAAYIGYVLIVVLFLMKMSDDVLFAFSLYCGSETGLLSRTILITAIYRKVFVLSGKAKSLFTNGKITNLMSTDTTRIDYVCSYFHVIWSSPIQICIALGLLIVNIGLSALVGFALLVLMGPMQGIVMSFLARTRAKAASVTDERVKLTQEILLGIKEIKCYAWEDSFADALNKLRNKELGLVRSLLVIRSVISGVSMVVPVFACILSFVTFSLTGGSLDAGIVFSSLALFSSLKIPLLRLPLVIASIADAYVAINRISEFLQADELSGLPVINPDEQYAIKVTDGEFIWETFTPDDLTKTHENSHLLSPRSQLCNINIKIPRGKLIAIVGSVGSGKSSLLSALVGEMKRIKGDVSFGGNVGYCPQTAWIQNATLRDNITFGLPFDEERYQKVIKDCCLEPDLEVLPAADLTEIGERGINLSGGQKQRVSIARAVYYNADIVLLDDPLSAVDAYVGKYIFTNCIKGALAKKTRLLVTHHLHYLPQVDYIIYMEDGKIAEQGTYEELMNDGKTFSKLIAEYGEAKNSEVKKDKESTLDEKENKNHTFILYKGLMSKEEQYRGAVNNEIYLAYFRNAGGFLLILTIILLLIMAQVANIGTNIWLMFWSNNTFNLPKELYIGIYCAWGATEGIFYVLCGILISYGGVKAARRLHDNAIKRILKAPTSFFDTTPLGRIINRKDVDTCDNLLSESFRMFFLSILNIIGTFILIVVVYVWFIIPLVPLIILYYLVALYYRASNRELKRLDSVLRSSLYAHFSETLLGLPIIRAYREQERFLRNNEAFLDIENRAYFLMICAQQWLSVRLEAITNVLLFFASLFGIIFRFSVLPSMTGLVMAYALQVIIVFCWCIKAFAKLETNMNSVERLIHYSENLEVEAKNIIPDNRPSSEWPTCGEIHIKNLEIKYRLDSPLVLKGISIDIMAAEKIGIVGRTGCGKSTLANSFFRLIEATSGNIIIDNIDISTIGLQDLRSNITIIPQDPVLFNGTIRSNLDPFNKHSDLELWDALCRVHLIENSSYTFEKKNSEANLSVSEQKNENHKPLMLDSPVKENGLNFSQGQKQLIEIARALVRHSKLIIIDEATASIDFKTDHLIQATIREEFKDHTVITIAHRLRTVADYDRILVMDSGNVIEFDIPYLLMQKSDGVFRKMCKSSGEFAELMEIAKHKFENISSI